MENGDIQEADMFNRKIRMMGAGAGMKAEGLVIIVGILVIVAGNT